MGSSPFPRLHAVLMILAFQLSATVGYDADTLAAWVDASSWLSDRGAKVHGALRGHMALHGGRPVRGVATDRALETEAQLISVPKKLWLMLEHFPEFEQAELSSLPGCGGLAEWEVAILKFTAAVASELQRGPTSEYASWLRRLPSLKDFESFHPYLISAELGAQFAALPAVQEALATRSYDSVAAACLDSWQRVQGSPVAHLRADVLEHARLLAFTRTYDVSGDDDPSGADARKYAMIPGSDFLNTAEPGKLNTYWTFTDDSFEVLTTAAIPAGEELYESYCDDCDNDMLLQTWGVYLEDNSVPLNRSGSADCWSKGLQRATAAALDLQAAASARAAGWRAPRCTPAALTAGAQGPLRCSLARLAWEYCAQEWRRPVSLISTRRHRGPRGAPGRLRSAAALWRPRGRGHAGGSAPRAGQPQASQ